MISFENELLMGFVVNWLVTLLAGAHVKAMSSDKEAPKESKLTRAKSPKRSDGVSLSDEKAVGGDARPG